MCPNIIIGSLIIPSWYALVAISAVVTIALAVYLRPRDFMLSRISFLGISLMVVAASLLGARMLFIALHPNSYQFTLSNIVSYRGGFAYFGALVLSVAVLWIYTIVSRKSFPELMDYIAPFLMLSQVFVRIGCLMAGCCYGKPTGSTFGFIFKTVDKVLRHPTQGYEAILLVAIYVITRIVYEKKRSVVGYTFFLALFLYGIGRFVIEFFRVDSPAIFLNITLAQVTCLVLAALSLIFLVKKQGR